VNIPFNKNNRYIKKLDNGLIIEAEEENANVKSQLKNACRTYMRAVQKIQSIAPP
jgi:hypothetical protein